MKKLFFAILIGLTATACKQGGTSNDNVSVQEVALAPPPPLVSAPRTKTEQTDESQPISTVTQSTSKKIIKEGEVRFETGDLQKTKTALTGSLQKLGGYVEEEREDKDNQWEQKQYTLKIRIPAQDFDKFLSVVSESADRVESKSIRIKDVTTEFIDITTRLNNKKLLENRYKDLLAKAAKMADILEVENKLNEIRTDIETTQGQLNYLNKQIAYSSLDITFFTKSTVGNNEGNGFGYKLKLALTNSWELLQSIFFGLITAWPLILICLIFIIILRRWLKRKKEKQL